MADTKSSVIDVQYERERSLAIRDWLEEMASISEGLGFFIELLLGERQYSHAASALTVFQQALEDRVQEGQDRFID